MTETKHTPGPWIFWRFGTGDDKCQDFGVAADVDGNKIVIAHCFGKQSDDFAADARANATLIAAAPDMYEALQWIVENADEDSVVSAAKAALAKARGEGE
jgi:dihydrodipicolinate synthase/N-acetylneuraminate lyase